MSKPASVPTWATNANYAASSQPWASTATKVQPPSGVQAEGHNPEDPLVAQYENWQKNAIGLWLTWLNGFAMDANGNGDIVMDAGKNVVVSGAGLHKRGAKTRHIAASKGKQVGGTAMTESTTNDVVTNTAASCVYRIPIDVDEGERLTLVECRCQSGTTETLTMKVFRQDFSGGSYTRTQVGSTANTSNGTALTQTISSGAITESPGSSYFSFYAEFTCTFVSGSSIGMLSVTTDIP